MKFKSKRNGNDSFRIPGQALDNNKCFDFEKERLNVPKLKDLKIVVDRQFKGVLKSITVSKNNLNQFFVSALVEESIEEFEKTDKSVGIDLGLKDLIITSDNHKILNPNFFRDNQSKLKKAQQRLSRKKKNSKRFVKQKEKIAKLHLKVSNQRNYFLHNLSTYLIKNYDYLYLETLNIKGMVKNRKLAKSISDAAWGTFVNMLKYKGIWYGKNIFQIETFFPSSKLCCKCNFKNDELKLKDREWICPECGTLHDRDLNAAINILKEGQLKFLGLIEEYNSAELTEYRRGGEIRPLFTEAHPLKRLEKLLN